MAFSQELLNRMARITTRTEGPLVLATTFATRAYASATLANVGPVTALWESYSDHILAMQALIPSDQVRVEREDRRVRVQSNLVTWEPTLYDEAVQPDTSRWRVISIGGGPLTPSYLFQVRRLPPR